MKSLKNRTARSLIVCILLLLLPKNIHAWEPNTNDLDVAVNTGDFAGYFANISAWLDQKTPSDPGKISLATLTALIEDPVFRNTLDQRQFLEKHGVADMNAFAKVETNKTFLAWVMKNTRIMDLYLEAAAPSRDKKRELNTYTIGIDSLERWQKLYAEQPDSREGIYLELAMATALWPPGGKSYGSGLPIDWMSRYKHYETAHKNKELFTSFDTLLVGDYGRVINSWASDRDLAWGRQMVNTWRPDLRDKEQIPQIVSEVWRRFSPFPFSDGFPSVLAGGGKCGPRAFFGRFICQAFGIPAIGIGQPGHACFAAKVAYPELEPQPGSAWKVYQGRGWHVSDCGDAMWGTEFLAEMAKRDSVAEFSRVEHLRWLASTLTSEKRSAAVLEVARNIWRAMPVIDWEVRALDCTLGLMPLDSKPDETCELDAFEAPKNVAENYGSRVRGFIYPPQSGEYEFRIASDDHSELFLSTDDGPENKKHIAHVWGWAGPGQFDTKPSQKSEPVRLEAGKRYYIEAIHRELDGPDHLSVAWSGPGVTEGVIPGKYLSPYPSGAKGKIVRELWLDLRAPVTETESATKPEPHFKPELPFKPVPGVIHVEAESFTKASGVFVHDCFTGGKQVYFPKIGDNWGEAPRLEYVVEVPETGVYGLTMRTAAPNYEQSIEVGFGTDKPVAVEVPYTRGLWGTTPEVEVRLQKGTQRLTLTRRALQRGVALRYLELKPKAR